MQYLIVAAETQNLQAASRLLKVSPAALSKSLHQLEIELSTKLFLREGRKIILTDDGARLAQKATSILQMIEANLYKRTVKDTEPNHIRLGSFEVFTTYFMGVLVKQELSTERFSVLEVTPGQLEIALEENRIDLGITYIPIPRPNLDFLKITQISMNIYVCKSSAFLDKDIKDIPFAVPITPVSGSPTRVKGLDGWPDDRILRYRKYQVSMMETALELARQGMAAVYLPDFICSLHNKLSSVPLVKVKKPAALGQSRQSVYLVKRKSTPEDQVFKKIARCLRQVCNS